MESLSWGSACLAGLSAFDPFELVAVDAVAVTDVAADAVTDDTAAADAVRDAAADAAADDPVHATVFLGE